MDKFNEFYMLQNQAKKFEQSGLDDKALELYQKIIAEYVPNNDFSFDRAATLLEKKFKYPEAIAVCEKAMERIKAGDLPGDAEKFRLKIERIRSKAGSDAHFKAAVSAKEPEDFHFGLPGFRTHRRLMMILGTVYYTLAALLAYPDQFYTFMFLFAMAFVGSYGLEVLMKLAARKACLKALAVVLIALTASGYALANVPQVKAYWNVTGMQPSKEEGPRTGDGTAPETPDTERTPPEIPEKYLTATANTADKHPATELALVSVDMDRVVIDLIVKPGTNLDTVKSISEDMVRTLGGLMTSENLKGPGAETPGELYDFYSAAILVTDTLEQTIAEGQLAKKGKVVNWTTP